MYQSVVRFFIFVFDLAVLILIDSRTRFQCGQSRKKWIKETMQMEGGAKIFDGETLFSGCDLVLFFADCSTGATQTTSGAVPRSW